MVREQSLFVRSGSHDEDGRQAHIWYKPLEIFLETEYPMVSIVASGPAMLVQ